MDNLDDILEFVDSVHYQGGELRKSHVKATVRHLKSGKAVAVKEHEDKRVRTGADLDTHIANQIRSHFDEGYTFKKEYPVTLQANGRTINFIGRKDKINGPIKLYRMGGDKVHHYVLSDGKNALTEKGTTHLNDYAREQFEKVFGGKLNKSLIHAFKRLLSSGKQVMVAEHSDKRQPRGDFASTSVIAGLGQAAKEAAAQAKPVVPFFQALKKIPVDRLHAMRQRLGALSHKTLMKEHNGRPLHFWLAAVDGELGRREGATA